MYTMNDAIKEPEWEYAEELRRVRGALSMEKAANLVGTTRVTWDRWERKKQKPSDENLKTILEVFGCSPEVLGYTPPEGYRLIPNEFFEQYKQDTKSVNKKLDLLLRRVGAA